MASAPEPDATIGGRMSFGAQLRRIEQLLKRKPLCDCVPEGEKTKPDIFIFKTIYDKDYLEDPVLPGPCPICGRVPWVALYRTRYALIPGTKWTSADPPPSWLEVAPEDEPIGSPKAADSANGRVEHEGRDSGGGSGLST